MSSLDLAQVPVQLDSEEIVTVNIYDRALPVEFSWAKHILTNPMSRWDIMSSFHKSLRAGISSLAVNWGRLFVMKMGEKTVRSYLKRILFEETRNLELYSMMLEERPVLELISLFTKSKKKWELHYYRDHFWNWNRGHKAYVETYATDKKSSFERALNESLLSLDGPKLYALNYAFQDHKDRDEELLTSFKARSCNKLVQRLIESRDKAYGSMYYRMVLLELLNGYWAEEANEFRADEGNIPFYVPRRLLWYFDIHTKAKKLIVGRYDELRPGPGYRASELDLRMSGQVLGVGYRFSVDEPLKSTFNHVVWSDEEWDTLKLHELRFYKI